MSSAQPQELLSINVPLCFNSLLWTSVQASSRDLVIGAFDDGRIEVYDIQMLLSAESSGLTGVPDLHSGPVKALCLSNFQPNLFASGAVNGEIVLWDLDSINKSSLVAVKKSDKFTDTSDLAWNPHIPQIIAASSSSGVISIIDLRSKKEITSLSVPGVIGTSSIAWNPEIPTSILTGNDDSEQPFVNLWDLRSSACPQMIFKSHTKEVSSLSWCKKDSGMALSSGKDSKVFCWCPDSNEIIKEYNYEGVFNAHWFPNDPNIICLSSYQNGTEFHSITEINKDEDQEQLLKANPKWLNCPIGASFGGDNLCTVFRSVSNRICRINPKIEFIYVVFKDLIQFESAIKHNGALDTCVRLLEHEKDNEKIAYLKMMKSLFSTSTTAEIVSLTKSINCELFDNSEDNYIPILSDLLSTSDSRSFENGIALKILKSDFEGAMLDCIKIHRFADAIIISDCGGNELRKKAEVCISKYSNNTYIQLAKSIRLKDFDKFVEIASLKEWRTVLEGMCTHAEPESIHRLSRILAKRLIDANLQSFACYPLIIAGDLEEFLEIMLKNTHVPNPSSSMSEILDKLVFEYKILRILEDYQQGFINCLEKVRNKTSVFEILTKLKSIFTSFGLGDCVVSLLDTNFFNNHLKNKNEDIDSFIEIIRPFKKGHSDVPIIEDLVSSFKNDLGMHSNPIYNSALNMPEYSPKIDPFPVHSLQTSTTKYNDAPIINRNLSKLSSHIGIQGKEELNVSVVSDGLNFLSKSIESKSITEIQARMCSDIFKKLLPETICSKEYSSLSKNSIVALFNELALGKIEPSATLATNILTTFFSETKEWILPLKRLIEIAKN